MFFITIPHSSAHIPDAFSARIHPSADLNAMLEPGIDRIFSWDGVDMIAAEIHQCLVNCNRSRDNINPRTQMPYAITTPLFPQQDFRGTPIFNQALTNKECEDMLHSYYDPFHKSICDHIASGQYSFFLDVHAMNSATTGYQHSDRFDPKKRPDICISNNGVASGAMHSDGQPITFPQKLLKQIVDTLSGTGYTTSMNMPFRGGYIIQKYGTSIPCLQIEINKQCYMTCDSGEIIPEKIMKLHKDLQSVFVQTENFFIS